MEQTKRVSSLFRVVKYVISLFYPKMEIIGRENLPEGPVIIVGNHSQIHGPLACELFFPEKRYTWCAGEMMDLKKVPDYAYKDFWSYKPKYLQPLFRLLSYIIAPIAVFIFNNANTIAVHHDLHIMSTFKVTLAKLHEGNKVVIFPEHDTEHNNIIFDFQDKFIDVAKLYHKRHGEELPFVPMYIAPNLNKIVLGKAVYFNGEADPSEERSRIKEKLMSDISEIGRDLPRHRVIPYRNMPKKDYPWSKEANS